ncbi:hypothetical protein DES53_1145 [Roseimicrobium gellanilyticum]|uniref:Uncharacterized protein n=1 Tax=Roseimicrobium gellanilyticum TaxID=748857 RepID=A0A366H5C2_9BACT|nr:hypothetical protein [Roseimicrobium gellanilyticum]RBP37267.1 hypothetical protein DES53_1145 [Roseimicrobium gellanilyticum]
MPEDARSDQADGHSHAAAWLLGISGAILFYILSPPPLAWMFEHFGWNTPTWPQYVYAPLIILYDQFEPVKNFYDSYSKLLGVTL